MNIYKCKINKIPPWIFRFRLIDIGFLILLFKNIHINDFISFAIFISHVAQSIFIFSHFRDNISDYCFINFLILQSPINILQVCKKRINTVKHGNSYFLILDLISSWILFGVGEYHIVSLELFFIICISLYKVSKLQNSWYFKYSIYFRIYSII